MIPFQFTKKSKGVYFTLRRDFDKSEEKYNIRITKGKNLLYGLEEQFLFSSITDNTKSIIETVKEFTFLTEVFKKEIVKQIKKNHIKNINIQTKIF